MTPERERQILAHLYGTANGELTALRGRWATEEDAPRLIGDWRGCWLMPGVEYHPSAGEMIVTIEEAADLARRKLVAYGAGTTSLAPTAPGRDRWRRIGSPTP